MFLLSWWCRKGVGCESVKECMRNIKLSGCQVTLKCFRLWGCWGASVQDVKVKEFVKLGWLWNRGFEKGGGAGVSMWHCEGSYRVWKCFKKFSFLFIFFCPQYRTKSTGRDGGTTISAAGPTDQKKSTSFGFWTKLANLFSWNTLLSYCKGMCKIRFLNSFA